MISEFRLDFDLIDRNWGEILANKSHRPVKHLRIICPYIKETAIKRLEGATKPQNISVITRFKLEDMAAGVNDISALEYILSKNGEVHGIKNLHAKVFIFDDQHAFVTSANLTDAALFRGNHEFGIRTANKEAVRQCICYFDSLWGKSNKLESRETLEEWKQKLRGKNQVERGKKKEKNQLPDYGADVDFSTDYSEKKAFIGSAEKSFVKFFGRSTDRVGPEYQVISEIEMSGSNWTVCYPKNKRPRNVLEESTLFYGRLMDDGDIRIFARAIGHAHDVENDNATEEDKLHYEWKNEFPRYIRVSKAEFLDGKMGDGISMNFLMEEFRYEAFASTFRNFKEGGAKNTNPRNAYSQQAAVELTPQASAWLNEKLENAFQINGKIPETDYKHFYNPTINH